MNKKEKGRRIEKVWIEKKKIEIGGNMDINWGRSGMR